uniref:Uncharacterized protein n=1 Tax=Laurenciella marilzae TaxID=1413812 RepID=A0A1Z1M148_9FLOR|nr:hypothetical protein [Laurenciella marilzae]ARW59776.1 hypothetical protein [Laurenciella marilzae]
MFSMLKTKNIFIIVCRYNFFHYLCRSVAYMVNVLC